MVLPAPAKSLTGAGERAPDPGLNSQQAAQRLAQYGPNTLPGDAPRTWLVIGRELLREPMFVLLMVAGVLYMLLGDLHEGLVMFGMVLVVLALTLYQEGKTEHALASLRALANPQATVIRNSRPERVAGSAVVPGDLLVLSEGDRVAADATLLRSTDVEADESLLTGESLPVAKAQADRLFGGTLVVRGHGLARVTATGALSEMGRIGAALKELRPERSPLTRQTQQLVRVLAVVAVSASVLMVVLFGLMRGDWWGAVLAGIALAMALLPQEFTVVLTVLPALGAWRLSRQQVLTRRIAAIETLGATSVLCVDKTGTLTENRMTVAELYAHDALRPELAQWLEVHYQGAEALPEAFHALVEFAILASVQQPFDPMEKAFHRLGDHFLQGSEHLHRDWNLVREYGLTPELRAMSHVWRGEQAQSGSHAASDHGHVVAAKGAPEAVMDLCHLEPAEQARVEQAVEAMAAKGLRVLGVARARFAGAAWPPVAHDFAFEFVGLLGLADPLRAEIAPAVAQCHSAGIRVIMMTGDYPSTALAIARQARLAGDRSDGSAVLRGDAMDAMDEAQLRAYLQTASVCARVSPTQKLRIVQALKAHGEIVAMTGDGVNDAPALKAAHVGVAMGGRGTEVARQAASVVLVDDNFASIVGAVALGRRIFDNLRKSMSYILAVHVPIAGIALVPILMGWPVVLYPLHIAFLELVIDPACSMVFENEPSERDVMQQPPRDANARLFAGATLAWPLLQGAGMLAVAIGAALWSSTRLPEGAARAFVFVTLVVGNIALIFSNRSRRRPVWRSLGTPNRTLWMVTVATLAMLGMTLYVPALSRLFFFAPLPGALVALAAALGAASVLWFELLRRVAGAAPDAAGHRAH